MVNPFKDRPEWPFYLACLFLLLSWAMIGVIDVANLFGLRQRLYGDEAVAFFWFHWFRNPVEQPLQVTILGGAMYLFLVQVLRLRDRGEKHREARQYAGLMAFGLALMMVEDSMNIRHFVRIHLELWTGEGKYGVLSSLWELLYFAWLGSVLLYVFLRYRHVFWKLSKTARFLVVGYGFYALAVALSWAGSAFRDRPEIPVLYDLLGGYVIDGLFRGDPKTEAAIETANAYLMLCGEETLQAWCGQETIDFWIMNRVVEESIEFLGAAALLTAAVAFLVEYPLDDEGDSLLE